MVLTTSLLPPEKKQDGNRGGKLLQDSLEKTDLLPERSSERGSLVVLFLAVFQIEAVCMFPCYIPPLSASQLSCFVQRGEKPASCLTWEMLVMFHPGLESTRGMLERPGQGVLKPGPPPPLAQALCSLSTHHLPPPLRDHRCPFLLLAGPGMAKQGRKIDLLSLGNDFQLKDECSGEREMGDRVFIKAQRSNFPCHLASGRV